MKKILFAIVALVMATTISAQTIFQEDFENVQASQLPAGWVTYGDNLTTSSQVGFLGNAWTVAGLQGGGQVAASASWTNESQAVDRWLITPQMNINVANASLIFIIGGGGGEQMPEHLKIKVSTTDNQKESFTEVADFADISYFEERTVDLSAYEGQDIYIAFVNCGNAIYLMMDEMMVGVLPELAMEMVGVNIPAYSPQNEDVHFGGTIVNKGTSPITSFDAYYTVDGEAQPEATISNINVARNETYDFTIETPFNSNDIGTHEIEVFVTNINGDETVELTNNSMTGSTMVYDASEAYDRTILLEHFTTGKCPNCPSADKRIAQAVSGRDDIIWLAHHAGFYSDEMTIPEDETLTVFYNSGSSTYAPGIMLDRTHLSTNPEDPGAVFFPGDPTEITNYMNMAAAIPSFATLDIYSTNFNADSRELTISVSGSIAEAFDMDSPRLSVYLMEDSVLAPQAGVQGKKYHMHVMRDAITDVWGEELTEKNFDKTYTFTMPNKFKAHRCKVVAFISNFSDDVNNRQVINSDQTGYLNAPYVGIDEVGSNVVMNVYPNPTTDYAKIEASSAIRTISIVNTLGQEVYRNNAVNAEEFTIDAQHMNAGMYVVTINTDNGIAVRRMTVAR